MRELTTSISKSLIMENATSGPASLRALVSVDCVILKFEDSRLHILLVEENALSRWSLPRRLMQSNENASDAAAKLVVEYVNQRPPFIEQVYTFTDVTNDQPYPTISITYVALTDGQHNNGQRSGSMWFLLSELPQLVTSHLQKVNEAIAVVKRKATYDPLYFDLLPERFTLPQLRKLFEEIYGEPFDQRNFNKKFKALGLLIKLNEKETTQSKKGAYYYMFDRSKYQQMQRPTLKFAHLLY
jgi:8-oxo-dGTP diphosphatase